MWSVNITGEIIRYFDCFNFTYRGMVSTNNAGGVSSAATPFEPDKKKITKMIPYPHPLIFIKSMRLLCGFEHLNLRHKLNYNTGEPWPKK